MSNKRHIQSPIENSTEPSTKYTTRATSKMGELDITNRLDQILSEQRSNFTSINKQLENLSNNVNEKIDTIEKSCNANTTRLNDRIDRISLSNELRLSGIPKNPDTNLPDLFLKIANHIKYDTSSPISIPMISHIKARNKTTNEVEITGTILMQFVAPHIKTTFYNQYLRCLPVALNNIGFETDSAIIISENLTKQNVILFREAYNLKKSGNIFSVFTINGQVNIKINKGDRAIPILNKIDLDVAITKATCATNNEPKDTTMATNAPATKTINNKPSKRNNKHKNGKGSKHTSTI